MGWAQILGLVGALVAFLCLAPFSKTYRRCKYQRGYHHMPTTCDWRDKQGQFERFMRNARHS